MEAEDKSSKNNYSKLVILRQSNDGSFYCKLSLRNDQKNEISFRLGTALNAEKYIQQYLKIFTEEGRRQVSLKHNLIEKPSENKPNYSTFKKPKNTSLVQTGLPFQSISPIQNIKDDQLQSYQMFLQNEFQKQRKHFEQLKRTRSSSIEDSMPNIKTLVTQPSPNQKIYANLRNLSQNSPIVNSSNTTIFNQKNEKSELPNGIIQSQKIPGNNMSSNFASTSSSIANNNVIQVLMPKMAQTSQKEKTSLNEQNSIKESLLSSNMNEIQSNKKSPKRPKTPVKRQTKKKTNSTTMQIFNGPKSSTNETNGDQNFKPTSTKIINASTLIKKMSIDNRPMIVTLNSDTNKIASKATDDTNPTQNESSPLKTTAVQFFQKSTPVINLNSGQNKIYSQDTAINSSSIKKLNQDQIKQANEPIYLTSPSGIKAIQQRTNYIFPSTVKTIPINSKTSQQFFSNNNSLENHNLFNKSLNNSQQTTSVILLTNNSNTNTPKSN